MILAIIALVVSTSVLPAGWTPEFTQQVMEVTAWEEGRNCLVCARGDHGHSVTTWQIWARDEAHRRQLEANPELAARYALHVMVLGAKICPAHPLAPYCGGCNSKAAQEISDHRMDLAGFYTELHQPN